MRHWFLMLPLLTPLPSLADDSARLREAAFAHQQPVDNRALELKNQSVLRYLWADVYAAAFYGEPGIAPRRALAEQRPSQLELYYFRDIARDDVIRAAWVTLERQQPASALDSLRDELDRLHASFADIRAGDRYALRFTPEQGLRLLRNGQEVFASDNAQLAQVYFGIWLAPEGLSDELRDALLAER